MQLSNLIIIIIIVRSSSNWQFTNTFREYHNNDNDILSTEAEQQN